MFSAFNYRNAIIGSVAVASYRDYCSRSGVPFRSRNYSREHNRNSETSNGLLFLMVTLSFMLFMLLMIPSLIEPPVLYIVVVFSLLSIIFVIGFTNSYLKSKQRDTTEEDRHISNDCNNFSNLIAYEVSDEQRINNQNNNNCNNNNNICNNNSSDELSHSLSSDLPPKYELPPSYSQTIYSINI